MAKSVIRVNSLIELCSNSNCALQYQCSRAVVHHIDLESRVGLSDRGIKIRHFHPAGHGRDVYCNHLMKKERSR